MTRRRSSITTSGPLLTSCGVTVIVVESPVVVLCNLAGNGFAGTFLASGLLARALLARAFLAKAGLTIFGERSTTLLTDFLTGATFLTGAIFLDVLTAVFVGAFLTGTVFTAFLVTGLFAAGRGAEGAFLGALLLVTAFLGTTFCATAFLAVVRFAVGAILIVASLLSPHQGGQKRPPEEFPASEKARAKRAELPTAPR